MPTVSTNVTRPTTQVERWTTWNYGSTGILDPNQPVLSTINRSHTVFSRQKSWERNPNYLSLQRSHARLPDQSFSFQEHRSDEGGSMRIETSQLQPWGARFRRIEEIPANRPNNFYFAADTRTLVTLAQLNARLLEKQRGSQWNAPVFFAEGRKTADMVVNRAAHLVGLVRALRRGDANRFFDGLRSAVEGSERRRAVNRFNRHYGRRPSQAAANMWLEYAYGWTPFMGDVQSATNTLMDMAERSDLLTGTTRARVRMRSPRTDAYAPDSWHTYARLSLQGSFLDHSRNGVWRWEPLPGSIPARLGLTNPLVVMWELLPLSFVADWFLPIGDYLSQLDTRMRVRHVGGTYGERRETVNVLTCVPRLPFPSNSVTSAVGQTFNRTISVSRTVMTTVPSIGITDMWFKPELGARRITSALALLRQNLNRLSR